MKNHYKLLKIISRINIFFLVGSCFFTVFCAHYKITGPIEKKILWKDVAPIIKRKCTICHNPSSSGMINYMSYEDVIGRRAMFKHVIEKGLMPPWFVDPNTGPFENDLSLTPKEKAVILKWLSAGNHDNSNRKKLQLLKDKAQGLKPDYIISLPEKVLIPAEEGFTYKRFIIPTNFKEDKWVKNIKFFFKPKVIHHAFLYVIDNSYDLKKGIPSNIRERSISVFGSAGSEISNILKTDIRKKIGYSLPRGSKLILEIHYESIGYEVIDDFTHIHINFFKRKPKYKTVIYTIAASDNRVNIPAQASNHQIKSSYKTEEPLVLLAVYPHMHLRGKANAIFIIDSKGRRKKIFGLNPFLVKFERGYSFKKPIKVPKGSTLECINWFDNSKNNPVNPNPNINVTYGFFIKDEMSLCHFTWLVPIDSKIRSRWIKVSY